MSTRAPDPRRSDRPLQARLVEQAPVVVYDVEQGLTRHQRLLTEGAALPDWAAELPPVRRGMTRLGKAGWWLLGGLLMLAVWYGASGLRAASVIAPASTHAVTVVERADSPRTLSRARFDTPSREARHETRRTSVHATAPRVEPLAPTDVEAVKSREVGTTAMQPSASTDSSAAPTLGTTERDTPDTRLSERATSTSRVNKSRRDLSVDSPRVDRRKQARPSTHVQEPVDAEEMRQLSEAERLLSVDARAALALVRAGQLEFRTGYFTQERSYLEVMALFALGRRDEAHDRAALFMSQYPLGPYRHKVELALLRYPAR